MRAQTNCLPCRTVLTQPPRVSDGATFYFYTSSRVQAAYGCDGAVTREIVCTPVDMLSVKEASCDSAVASVLGESFVAAPHPADAVTWHESESLALFEQQRAGPLPDAHPSPTRRAVDHAALVAGDEVEAWLSLCGDGQCDAPSDGESDRTDDDAAEPVDVCQEEESWGYGGEEGSCEAAL